MSHRNGKPKTHASERTWRRYRLRHNISTPQDIAHFNYIREIKDRLAEWLGVKPAAPVVNDLVIKGGRK